MDLYVTLRYSERVESIGTFDGVIRCHMRLWLINKRHYSRHMLFIQIFFGFRCIVSMLLRTSVQRALLSVEIWKLRKT